MTRPTPEAPAPEFVTCETVAAVVHHIRRVDAEHPIKYGGHWPKPRAVCGREVDWDTRVPPDERCVSCRRCRVEMGWPEMMEPRRG